jgi:hypothetical protein
VYKAGVLTAQLYYVDGDVVGWGADAGHNIGAVDMDKFCALTGGEPPGTGCSWSGPLDGWHWHSNLCTIGIGTPQASALPGFSSQESCAALGDNQGHPCTFPPAEDFTCAWDPSVGWMGHLWNWLPNANYTNALAPTECTAAFCNVTEANGRFADCFPDASGWNAYNCPQ